jgi:4-diphosphocytidyl-2-C-methyl-D-erythritol kinase
MKIVSPAKVNLFLHVTGRRPDGYHTIRSLMCCVSLYDNLTFDFSAPEITVACNHPDVPENESNIAYRAARCFLDALHQNSGVAITIEKHIPVAAGLGGGSSNAATVLLEMNARWGYPFSMAQLKHLGLSLGADVPFFIFRKPALASGIGEHLDFWNDMRPYRLVLVYPRIHICTADVYKNLNLGLTKCEQKHRSSPLNMGFNPCRHLCNDLETVTVSRHPEIAEIKNRLLSHGAAGALMSGSGSTVFGIFEEADAAENAFSALSADDSSACFFAQILL